MNNCTHCGASLTGAVNFCKNCGGKLDKGKSLALSAKPPEAKLADGQATPVANETPTSATNSALTASVTSRNPPTANGKFLADRKKLAQGKELAFILGAGAAVLAFALVLVFTVFLNKPETERPLTVAEFLDLGEKYLLDLDYEQALVQYLAVIEIEPKNERAYLGAAEAYLGLGDKNSAAEILWEGYEITSNAEIWRMFGEVAAEQEPAVETAPEPMPEPTITENETEAAPVQSAQVGDIIEFAGYDWRVLDVQDGKMLVISEYVLSEPRPYHSEWAEITWANSDIRAYLNGEFYINFNDFEKSHIVQTHITNNSNPWFGTESGTDTQDYISLLCFDEVVRYFGDSGQLANRPNDDTWNIYDEYNAARIAYSVGGVVSWWWLRSPGGNTDDAACVSSDGSLYVYGHPVGGGGGLTVDGYSVADTGGVRPAMWLRTN